MYGRILFETHSSRETHVEMKPTFVASCRMNIEQLVVSTVRNVINTLGVIYYEPNSVKLLRRPTSNLNLNIRYNVVDGLVASSRRQ